MNVSRWTVKFILSLLFTLNQASAFEFNVWLESDGLHTGYQANSIDPIYHCGFAFGVPFQEYDGRWMVYPRFVDGEFNEYCVKERAQNYRRGQNHREPVYRRGPWRPAPSERDLIVPRRRSRRGDLRDGRRVQPRRERQERGRNHRCDRSGSLCVGMNVVIGHQLDLNRRVEYPTASRRQFSCETAYRGKIQKIVRRRGVDQFTVNADGANGVKLRFVRAKTHQLFTVQGFDNRFKAGDFVVFKEGQGQVLGFSNKTQSGVGGPYSMLIRRGSRGCVIQKDVHRTLGTATPCLDLQRKSALAKGQAAKSVCLGDVVTGRIERQTFVGPVIAIQQRPLKLVAIQYQKNRTQIVSVDQLVRNKKLARDQKNQSRRQNNKKEKRLNKDLQERQQRARKQPPIAVREKRPPVPKRKKQQPPVVQRKAPKVRPGFVHDGSNKDFQKGDVVVEMVQDPSIQRVRLVSRDVPKGKSGNIQLSNRRWYKENRLVNLTKVMGSKKATKVYEQLK